MSSILQEALQKGRVNFNCNVDRHSLEKLGRNASQCHLNTGTSLNNSVINEVQGKGLNDEQIRRVAEFANNHTFSKMFKQAEGNHRLITFEGPGPADPVTILNALKEPPEEVVMKTAQEYRRGLDSYELFHEQIEKTASAPEANVNLDQEIRDFNILKSAAAHAQHELRILGHQYERAIDTLCKEAQKAINDGISSSDVVRAVSMMSPNDSFTKLALGHLSQRVSIDDSVLMEKRASNRVVVKNHPICEAFENMVKVAMSYYEMAGASERLHDTLAQANRYCPLAMFRQFGRGR